ncbi:hypothetical protein CWD77_03965 [Rhodohalobacter barkolensis]|uniref:Uncharacterized protein n=1 Tax=Rhodohalobacter barkolensis TaxID=2053187 RepID=A0A2N0VKB1_9BACT|nr:hypothetical protein CWD77_03965 [Rhodohalobacter barkolensis]
MFKNFGIWYLVFGIWYLVIWASNKKGHKRSMFDTFLYLQCLVIRGSRRFAQIKSQIFAEGFEF